jgi:hypothetical protein
MFSQLPFQIKKKNSGHHFWIETVSQRVLLHLIGFFEEFSRTIQRFELFDDTGSKSPLSTV